MAIRKIITLALLIMANMIINAENISLPAPGKDGGLSVNRALSERHSVREFDSARTLDLQTVSDLLWAACGINRSEEGKCTNPTALNRQEVSAYWLDSTGAYLYDNKNNILVKVCEDDLRKMVAGTPEFSQDYVLDAPAAVVFVVDTTKFPGSDRAEAMCYVDAGIACENLNLYCAGNGLATVPRMSMDVVGLSKALNLPETSRPVLNNPVGYAK